MCIDSSPMHGRSITACTYVCSDIWPGACTFLAKLPTSIPLPRLFKSFQAIVYTCLDGIMNKPLYWEVC